MFYLSGGEGTETNFEKKICDVGTQDPNFGFLLHNEVNYIVFNASNIIPDLPRSFPWASSIQALSIHVGNGSGVAMVIFSLPNCI